ncbi:hypothetical protein [Streptomyces kronopolitis]|uniref:hypothetical protein n=1 Tax=Streptomyces kronopolitis TaxID=1612435 RepID=UPI003429BAB9
MTEDELEAALAKVSDAPMQLDGALRAQREAKPAPLPEPSVIPLPDFRAGGVVRFHCPRGCGWYHDENPGRDAATAVSRIVLPAVPTSADVTAAISALSNARAQAQQKRIETAFTQHDEMQHRGASC